jgi:restriction system protein
MEMPKWNELLGKTLQEYLDGEPHSLRDIKITVSDKLGVTKELRNEVTPGVKANKIEDRVGWAFYIGLKKAGLVEEVSRGQYRITPIGRDVLKDTNGDLDEQYLIDNIPSYASYVEKKKKGENLRPKKTSALLDNATPEELIGEAVSKITTELQGELLSNMQKMDPYQFESVVADLLKKMGYGESFTTKKSNDGGVDAIVNEDALGLSKIFAQAKRYAEKNIVQQKAIRDFLGSLVANGITKGVFITTSDFSKDAEQLARNKSVVLINGDKLTEFMIQYDIGVSIHKTYFVKRIDTDYFSG